MPELNSQQNHVVTLLNKPCLVIAGAGSGKTSTICQKIAYLAKKDSLYHKVLAITFTNKAAKEMGIRLKLLGVTSKQVAVMTFHSLGLRIIQRFGEHLGIKKNFTLYDTQDKHQLLKELMSPCTEQDMFQAAANISFIKHYAQDPASLERIDQFTLQIWERYEQALTHLNAVDLDDLVFKAFKLTERETVSQAMKETFGYIVVDEYQDTNIAQYLLFKNIIHPHRFTVVGDDDQSIYTWRGANPANLNILAQDFQNLEVIKLEENFRSSPEILKAANALIAHNNHLFQKELWSNKPPSHKITLLTSASEDSELDLILDTIIKRDHLQKTVCILFRTNYQAMSYEKGLRERKIPYQLLGASSIFNKTEIKDIVCYLRLLINPDDDQAFKRIANIPKRGLGPQSLSSLLEYGDKYNLSLLHSIQQVRFLLEHAGRNKPVFEQLSYLIERYRTVMHQRETLDWIDEFIADLDYYSWIEQVYTKKSQAEKKIKALNEFIVWLKRMHTKTPDLDQVIKKIMLMDMLDKKDNEMSHPLTLSTIHAAKGLEFDEVYIIGCLEGLLPHQNSDDNIQEERRLLYVAMTRAKERLVLSYSQTYGGKESVKSRFLSEIPEDFYAVVEQEGPKTWEELRLILGY